MAKSQPGECPHSEDCPYLGAAMAYEVSDEIIEHLQTFKHTSHVKLCCRYGSGCSHFKRVEAGEERPYDTMHLLTYKHPPRVGKAMASNSYAFTTAFNNKFEQDAPSRLMMSAGPRTFDLGSGEPGFCPLLTRYHESVGEFIPDFYSGWPVDGWGTREKFEEWHSTQAASAGVSWEEHPMTIPPPETGLGVGSPSLQELVDELVREGYGHELPIKGAEAAIYPTLQEKAKALQSHARNTGVWYAGMGDEIGIYAPPLRPGPILAVMAYTGMEVFSDYNSDKRKFYDKARPFESMPRFPVLDKLLMEAKFCLQPRSVPMMGSDHYQHSETLWCGMHRAYLSQEDRKNRYLSLAQDTSMSRDRGVAEFFLAAQGKAPMEGSLLQLEAIPEHRCPRAACMSGKMRLITHCPMTFGDVSWISKFPDEEETLVAAGAFIDIREIEVIQESPLIELVKGSVSSGWEISYWS